MANLCDHGTQASTAQGFFKAPQHGLLVGGFEEHHPIRRQAGLRQCWSKEVGLRQTPQHLAARPRRDTRRKGRCGGTIYCSVGATGHFMQRPSDQAPSGKAGIDCVNTKREDAAVE